jgi:hypothetical protein
MVILYKVCINNGPGITAEQLTAQIFNSRKKTQKTSAKGELKFGVLHNMFATEF